MKRKLLDQLSGEYKKLQQNSNELGKKYNYFEDECNGMR